MSARFAYKVMSLVVLFSLAFQPLTVMGKQVDLETSRQGVGASAPETGLYRTTVTVDSPARRARLDALGVTVLAEAPGQAIVLADADQLETLARLRFEPRASDDADALIAHHATAQPALAAAWGEVRQRMAANAQMAGAASLVSLSTPALSTALAGLTSIDDDADGLTNTEEAWWCTDPMNPDTDADGRGDGAEIQALKDWMANKRAGPPNETPWPSWPFNDSTCPDKDHDSIPNMAERWELGLDMDLESSDRDRYDDGQELFGTTYCPGSGNACGYGPLPSANHDGVLLFPQMPSWVTGAGKHPMVAAYPKLDFAIVKDSDGFEFKIRTATVVTTDQRHEEGETKSYSTTKTEGTSTSDAETETWENWQEYSKTTEAAMRAAVAQGAAPQDTFINSTEQRLQVTNVRMKSVTNNTMKVKINNTYNQGGGSSLGSELSAPVTSFVVDEACAEMGCRKYIGSGIKASVRTFADVVEGTLLGTSDKIQNEFQANKCDPTSFNPNEIWCRIKSAGTLWKKNYDERLTAATTAEQEANGVLGGNYLQTGPSSLDISRVYPITFPEPRFIPTETNTTGSSTGGARTTTNTTYEEHAVTEGTAKQLGQSWGTATAQNSVHAADLWFAYALSNTGNDYARVICDLAINVYIRDLDAPVATYYPGNDQGGDGCFSNFQPGESHKYSFATQNRIALTLDQLAAIDQGEVVRFVIEDYSLGQDDFYASDAIGAGVQIAIEDGTDDSDEAIDSYLIPTWGDETVLDVLARYFPHDTDADGMMVAIWTPEYRADTPAWCTDPQVVGIGSQRTLWCKHALSTADWWNVYTNGMGDGSEGFQDTPASPGATALFRFNQDSDLDGYSDRSELRLGTDPNDPASFAKPELIAGVHSFRSGNNVVATLSLLNTGVYDAYGVEAVMITPNDTISITNNTVGGSGRVRAQKQVIVGSRIVPQTPLPAAWLASGHAKPAAGGYYTGTVDLTYTFTAADSGSVGAGTLRLNWNDGAGGSGTLNFGAGYLSPNLIDVSNGVKLGLLSGTLAAGESFTIAATTPRDTFQYTIAPGHESDFTPPVVLVSYNDPQGNHRFGIPPAAANLGLPSDNLMAFSSQMQQEPGVEIVTTAAASAGANTTNLVVNNPTATTFTNAHLFLEFVDITGTVTLEVPVTTNLPPGPNVVSVDWSTVGFSPAYDPAQDYIVMAFWTDYQGNILDTAARPLSSFQADPKPAFAMADADATWDFGTAPLGTLLKRSFTFANTGALNLLTYVSAPAGLTVSQTGSRRVGLADMTTYEMALNTTNLAVGPYTGDIIIRTSDPANPTRTVHVVGTVTAAPADTPVGAMQHPLDWPATVSGTQGQWVEFAHTLGPEPLSSLHPAKVYGQDGVLKGVGRYATPFSAGTASYDMFGDGRDGDLIVGSGQTVTINTTRVNVSASGTSAFPANSSGFAVGDTVLFHQTQGTSNVGRSEFAQIATINSATNWTLARSLTYTYDNSSGRAQVIKVPQYQNVTVQGGGILTMPAWNSWTGGILIFRANGSFVVQSGGLVNLAGKGFGQPPVQATDTNDGKQGESELGPGSIGNTSPNGMGGGGGRGQGDGDRGGGGGGGHATPGADGSHIGRYGRGGGTAGGPDLSIILLGGGAGNGGGLAGGNDSVPGPGGGIVLVYARSIEATGQIKADGGNGWNGIDGGAGAGGGSGGSMKMIGSSVSLGNGLATASGGAGGTGGGGYNGGNGGVGRIRVEYCETLAGSTTPPASTQKLNCYIADQATDPTHGLLQLPESGTHTYQVQYGRKLNYGGAASQVTSLRVPAGLFTAVTLQALVSDLPSNAWFALDVGNTGSDSWNGTVGNGGEYTSPNLAVYFNAYWASHGAPTTGTLDVPVRVYLDRAGQVLLTNLQVTPAGSKTRAIRLPVRPLGYSNVAASFTVSGGSGPLAVGVDVGDNGSVDWTYTGSPVYPASLTTGNLAAAVNAYLAGKPDPTDVPIRFYLSPFATLNLTGFTATPVGQPDASIGAVDVTLSSLSSLSSLASNPTEGDTLTINATIHNPGALDPGPLTAAFYATPAGGTAWYIGSALVPSVPASSLSSVSVAWNTLGFTGTAN